MEFVKLPRPFVEELFTYFFTKLPMNQSEIAVNELRKALNQQEEAPGNGD